MCLNSFQIADTYGFEAIQVSSSLNLKFKSFLLNVEINRIKTFKFFPVSKYLTKQYIVDAINTTKTMPIGTSDNIFIKFITLLYPYAGHCSIFCGFEQIFLMLIKNKI